MVPPVRRSLWEEAHNANCYALWESCWRRVGGINTSQYARHVRLWRM
jgi:hypothetical protein